MLQIMPDKHAPNHNAATTSLKSFINACWVHAFILRMTQFKHDSPFHMIFFKCSTMLCIFQTCSLLTPGSKPSDSTPIVAMYVISAFIDHLRGFLIKML